MFAPIVLAAGGSSRMGRSKLLLELGGVSLLRRAVQAAVDAAVGPVVVVLGDAAARARAELDGLPCSIVADPSLPSRGMNASLAAGLAAVPAPAAGALVLLADMPLVDAAAIRALVERHRSTAAPLVATRYGDALAPPVLYARARFAELAAGGAGDGIGRTLLRRYRAQVEAVDAPPGALADVDGPADLERLRARLGDGGTR
ncbi:nucleotidyltransferase family protein [Anaeromyxobacter sp. Red801]|uniref:nucleotidyltransferase family protein n=1 Tax=Anaeromyxobacter sp. Red801 TaxID=3411632 RepID=UPI003B9E4678